MYNFSEVKISSSMYGKCAECEITFPGQDQIARFTVRRVSNGDIVGGVMGLHYETFQGITSVVFSSSDFSRNYVRFKCNRLSEKFLLSVMEDFKANYAADVERDMREHYSKKDS